MTIRIAALLLLVALPCLAHGEPIGIEPAQMPILGSRRDFVGENAFSSEVVGALRYLRSVPNRSAGGFFQEIPVTSSPTLVARWSWQVDRLHRTADIRVKEREDFGALVAFVFGEPSWWNQDVPTLAYVWTSTPVPPGSILKSTRNGKLAYVQLRDAAHVGRMQTESRRLVDDFISAFGEKPGRLRYVAILNDNDQTGEPASALFGPVSID